MNAGGAAGRIQWTDGWMDSFHGPSTPVLADPQRRTADDQNHIVAMEDGVREMRVDRGAT